MANKRDRPLILLDEPSQKTQKGLKILVSKRSNFFVALDEAAKKPD